MYKLVVFDLDGTLINIPNNSFIWSFLHEKLGIDKQVVEQNMKDFFDGKITYKEWFEKDVRLWAEKELGQQELLKAIEEVTEAPGALEVVQKLKNSGGMKIAVVSGSIDFVMKKVFGIHMALFDDVYINKVYFNVDGSIAGGKHTPYDFEGKAEALKEIMQKEGVGPEEVVFVGDEHNDIPIAEMVGMSVAMEHGNDELKEKSTHTISNLSELLNLVKKN